MGRRRSVSEWPNVSHFVDRNDHIRWRYRRQGYKTVILHGEPGSPEFLAELEEAKALGPLAIGSAKVKEGTFSALCVAYYESHGFAARRPVTRATYRNTLERFRLKNGDRIAKEMRRSDVLRIIDRMADRPSAANHLLQVLRILMRFGLDRGLIENDPTHKVRKLKIEGDGFPDWTDEQIQIYRDKWESGTKQRLAFELLLETGQRRGDVVKMGRQHIKAGRLRLTQSKTGIKINIPVTAALQTELDQVPAGQMTFLHTGKDAPFTPAGFGNWFREQCDRAGLGFVSAHGLRKAKARQLAEAGCTVHEIMAITGHKTMSEVERYTKAASVEKLADSAEAKRKART